jgi:CBS domain-containing protein
MLLKDICSPDVAYCSSDTDVLTAARMMRQRHVGDLVIVNDADGDQTPLGIVTDRDIVVEVLGKELDPRSVKVRDIMRTPAVIAGDSEDATQAIARMKSHGVRRIPVLGEHRKLVGIITLDDLIRGLAAQASALADVIEREQGNEQRRRR